MTRAVPARRMASTASDRSAGRGRFVAMMESVTAHKPTPSQKESRCRVVYSVPWPVGRARRDTHLHTPHPHVEERADRSRFQNREMPSHTTTSLPNALDFFVWRFPLDIIPQTARPLNAELRRVCSRLRFARREPFLLISCGPLNYNASKVSPSASAKATTLGAWLGVSSVTAVPRRPLRAVRPARCV